MSKQLKTADITKYNKEYMSDYYKKNATRCKLVRNSNRLKQNFSIDENVCSNYDYYLSNVVKITKLYQDLPDDMKSSLLNEIDNLDFKNISIKI
jgi:hypothetical protein